jgi:hypothetical protein
LRWCREGQCVLVGSTGSMSGRRDARCASVGCAGNSAAGVGCAGNAAAGLEGGCADKSILAHLGLAWQWGPTSTAALDLSSLRSPNLRRRRRRPLSSTAEPTSWTPHLLQVVSVASSAGRTASVPDAPCVRWGASAFRAGRQSGRGLGAHFLGGGYWGDLWACI